MQTKHTRLIDIIKQRLAIELHLERQRVRGEVEELNNFDSDSLEHEFYGFPAEESGYCLALKRVLKLLEDK